ncbi:organomercurial lyase [Streptomyces sp. NPDC056656]|uniref:organomercurial lyase n=1 Tax=Streptomyces sp. NPDC056656 TaxID=3345895 RepID=UPI0036B75D0D
MALFGAEPSQYSAAHTGTATSTCAHPSRAASGQDVTVSSSDPVDSRPVTSNFIGSTAGWEPAEAVVFIGRRDGEGTAATVCCAALNFFTGRTSAEQWTRQHPEVKGQIAVQERAVEIGVQTLGPLLLGE